jgi:C-terminal processing protease CtpA/Prc
MSSEFKLFLGNKYCSVLFLLVFSNISLAATPLKNECATLNLTSVNDKEQSVIYELISNNNSAVDNNAYLDNKKNSVFLLPGQHSFNLREWRLDDYIHYTEARNHGRLDELINKTINHYVLINVKPDINYQISTIKLNGQVELSLKGNERVCKTKKKRALSAKHKPRSHYILSSIILPNDLESRIYNFMEKIALNNYSTIKPLDIIQNITPLRLMGSFGLTFNHGTDYSQNELQVLTVYPFSVANTLKLASGDVIVNLDNKVDITAIDSPNNKLQQYINSLNIGDKIKITVIRNNEKKLITGDYLPTILPESHYRIMPNPNPNPNLEQFENNTCASISRYFQGIKGYKLITHNGVLLNDIYGSSSPLSLNLSPGVHRFEAVFSPKRIDSISLNARRYNTHHDIAPRVSGASRAGEDGVKKIMTSRTGSINGWFKNSTTKNNGENNYAVNSNTGRPLLSITMNVEKNNRYKLKVEEKTNDMARSFYHVYSKARPAELNCEEVLPSVISALLSEESLVESSPLTKMLRFELDQLLLEVKTYYRDNGINEGVIDIYRERKDNYQYGILGKMVDFESGYALSIKQITTNSMASLAGLRIDDKIIAFNGMTFDNKEPKEFLDELGKLSNGEGYDLLILRGATKEKISAVYSSNVLPAFHLSIDMGSVIQAKQALNSIDNPDRIKNKDENIELKTYTDDKYQNNRDN